jgi:predicted nucleotidyltransferase
MHSGKDATGVNLIALLEGLLQEGVEFILVGGLAAVVQGAPVTTLDVDILHLRSPENVAKLYGFIKSAGAIQRRPDDKVIIPQEEDFLGDGHHLLLTRLGPLDVLGAIEAGKTYQMLLAHCVEIEFRGHPLRVLDLETLIQLKRTSKDPKDLQRLSVLEETLRQLKEG